MASALVVGMICVAIIVAAALGALVVLLRRPARKHTHPTAQPPVAISQATGRGWVGWILPVIVAFMLTWWTIAGALFFLAVVWIMKLDPKPYTKEIPYPTDSEIKSAKGPYTWLFLSPFLTIPALILAASYLSDNASFNELVIAAIVPMVFHLPLLVRLDPKSAFVFRHTQQAFFLVALRAGMAALALSMYNEEGIWLFLMGNGALWLFGTLWARNEAIRGECWWIRRRGESIAPKTESASKYDLTRTVKFSPKENLEQSREFIQHFKKEEARDHALAAFRSGDGEARAQAVWLLEVLEEVEKF